MIGVSALGGRTVLRPVGAFLVIWAVLAVVNFAIADGLGVELGTPLRHFPISVFWFHPNPDGLPFLAAFWSAGLYAVYRVPTNSGMLWLLGLVLIVTGNLIQGDPTTAFLSPLQRSGPEFGTSYLHTALSISDPGEWLRSFTDEQVRQGTHGKTHPPFAVLLHYVLHRAGTVHLAAAFFVALASCLSPLFFRLLGKAAVRPPIASGLCVLFLLAPAVNIYSAVSLDAVIALFMTLTLYGMLSIVQGERGWPAFSCFYGGILGTSLLTFAVLFLFAVTGLVALGLVMRRREWTLTVMLLSAVVGCSAFYFMIDLATGYNHLTAFLQASRFENPHGFWLRHQPVVYLATRVENVWEIAVFASAGTATAGLAALRESGALRDAKRIIAWSGITVLLAMFMAGAFRTGETARACLFIYPYLFLPLAGLDETRIRQLSLIALAQTGLMQVLAYYFW